MGLKNQNDRKVKLIAQRHSKFGNTKFQAQRKLLRKIENRIVFESLPDVYDDCQVEDMFAYEGQQLGS